MGEQESLGRLSSVEARPAQAEEAAFSTNLAGAVRTGAWSIGAF